MTGSIRFQITWRGEQRDLIVEGLSQDFRHFEIKAKSGADDEFCLRMTGDKASGAEREIERRSQDAEGANSVHNPYGNVVGVNRLNNVGCHAALLGNNLSNLNSALTEGESNQANTPFRTTKQREKA